MNNRQIETSREIRLWITGIIGPVIIGTATILASNPELLNDVRTYVSNKMATLKKSQVKEGE